MKKSTSWSTIYFWSTSHQRTALLPHLCLYFCSNLSSQFVSSSSKFAAYSRFLSFCRLSVLPVLFFTKKLYLFHFVFLSFTLQSNMILTSLLPLSCIADRFLITLYLRVLHLFILSSWNSCKLLLPAFHAFCGAFSLVTWSLGVFIRCPALWAVFIPLPLYSGYLWLVWIYFSFKEILFWLLVVWLGRNQHSLILSCITVVFKNCQLNVKLTVTYYQST